jgi:hypothetical protein
MRTLAVCLIAGALALLAACDNILPAGDDSKNVYTLYRGSPPIPPELLGEEQRIHVATFDAAEREAYNRDNCEIARGLFSSQGVAVRYWCERGRFKP